MVVGCNIIQRQPADYTLSQVAEHDSAEDCWMVIDGNVYDVTEFIADKSHPGGDAILAGCGIDATELFNTRPMGSGTAHSDAARSLLQKFEIGSLNGE
jgi:cytochrome b involved in lipid metabolism